MNHTIFVIPVVFLIKKKKQKSSRVSMIQIMASCSRQVLFDFGMVLFKMLLPGTVGTTFVYLSSNATLK